MDREAMNFTLDGVPIVNGYDVQGMSEEELDLEIAKIYKDAEEFEATVPGFNKAQFLGRKTAHLRMARKATVEAKKKDIEASREGKLITSRTTLYKGIDSEVYDVLNDRYPNLIESVNLEDDGLWITYYDERMTEDLEGFLNRLGLAAQYAGEYDPNNEVFIILGAPVF